MKRTVQQVAEAVEARVQGDGSVQVSGVASIASASPQDLVFVEEEKYLARALQSGAGAVIAGEFAAGASGKPLLICRHPKLAFARAARFLQEGHHKEGGVHARAVVHASVRIGTGVVVEARAVIAEDAEIGDEARIGAGCAIGRGVKIGRECEIYPNVTIYAGTSLGERVIVHAGAVLGSDGFG
jgi:UDP-3-O-[3-hydroxymyristoyl] glucosamine N-acyltransferase